MKKISFALKIGLVLLMVGVLISAPACSKKKTKGGMEETLPGAGEEAMTDPGQGKDAQAISEEELAAQRMKEFEAAKKMEEERQAFLSEDIYFNFDDATLTAEARQVLKEKVAWLRANQHGTVVVEGHCDERGTEEYNIALGQRRAESVKSFIVNAGIGASRLKTISYGEERPVAFGNNESAWAKNRRGHFRLEH